MEDLFNVNPTLPEVGQPKQAANSNLLTVNLKKEPGQTLTLLIKFLPNVQNPLEDSLVSKYTAYLEDVATHQHREVEVMQGDGITETFFNLRNSGNPTLIENSKIFSRKLRFCSACVVLSAPPHHQDWIGRIFLFRFPQKLYDKINSEQQGSEYVQGRNVFNVLTSRNLLLKYKMVNGFPSTDDSQFIDVTEATTLKIPMQTATGVQMVPITQATVTQPGVADAFRAWLGQAPDITPYKASPAGSQHTDEEKQFIWNCIQHASDPTARTAVNGALTAPVFGATPAATPVVDTNALVSGPVNTQPQAQPQPTMSGMPQFAPTTQPLPQATTPGGFAASNVPDLTDVLGGAVSTSSPAPAAQQPAPATAPGGGLSLGDVLGEII